MSGHSRAKDILQEMNTMRRKGRVGPRIDDAVRSRDNHIRRHQDAGAFDHPTIAVDIDMSDRVPRRSVTPNCYSIIIANDAWLKLMACGESEPEQAADCIDRMPQHKLARFSLSSLPRLHQRAPDLSAVGALSM